MKRKITFLIYFLFILPELKAQNIESRNNQIGGILDSLEKELDDSYAGIFRYNKEAYPDNLIPIYTLKKINDSLNNGKVYVRNNNGIVFKVESIRLQIDYQRLYDIRLIGWIIDTSNSNNNKELFKIIRRISFSNTVSSILLSALNQQDSYLRESKKFDKGDDYEIKLRGLISYEPKGAAYSYMLKNDEYHIDSTNSFVKNYVYAKRKNLTDYLSLQIFLDPLGFMNEKPNGFVQLEGTATIPLTKHAYTFPSGKYKYSDFYSTQITSSLSYIYANSLNQDPRYAKIFVNKIEIDSTIDSKDTTKINYDSTISYTLNNLDFVRNYYYVFNTKYYLYTHEIKSWNAWFHISTGIKLWGSRIGPNRDSLLTYHRLFLEYCNISLEIRPDKPFGMNLNAGFGTLNKFYGGSGTNINLDGNNVSFTYKKSYLLPHEINFYYKLNNTNKGGLYFRYSGFVSINRDSNVRTSNNKNLYLLKENTVDFFPLILIGYATNISSLIKGEFGKNKL